MVSDMNLLIHTEDKIESSKSCFIHYNSSDVQIRAHFSSKSCIMHLSAEMTEKIYQEISSMIYSMTQTHLISYSLSVN